MPYHTEIKPVGIATSLRTAIVYFMFALELISEKTLFRSLAKLRNYDD